MDFLDSVMELLNSTPPPLRNSSNDMEPDNLSHTQSSTDITAAAIVEAVAAATPATPAERNLELKLPPILSSSSSDSESEEATNATGTAGTSAVGDGERAASPPPNCAICLGRCKNKCFTDSCMHQFCFKCLCEWSKVKPECPLCKQTFKSIIHNVKSEDQFEEYHVQPPTVQLTHPPFEMDFQEMRIFGVVHSGHNRNAWNDATHRPFFYGDFSTASPYSSSASTGGAGGGGSTGNVAIPAASGSSSNSRSFAQSIRGSRNQYVYRGELLDMYRQEYPGAIANSGTLSQLWRRYVYDRKLYAMPVADITGRFRESSARFYRDNPSQIHRLMPWINRDIVCLLRQTQHDVTSVLESIYSALTLMNILSPAFRRRVQPFLGTKTAHFIHELNNFARSPYDMIGYDRAVQYSPQSNSEEIVIEFTSSDESTDNEQIDVAGDSGAAGGVGSSSSNNNTSSSSSRSRSATNNASSINAINLTIHNRLTSGLMNAAGSRLAGIIGANNGSGAGGVGGLSDLQDDVSLVIDLRGESDNNETTSTAQATTNSSNYQNGQNTGTSEGGDMIMSVPPPTVSENIELTSGSSDECEFILERKPPHLRTPEMVSLDSASDSDVVFVEESKPLNKTSFSSSEGEPDDCPASLPKHHTRHNNKIAALVEAKKRNHSANLVKSEQQDSQTEIYNLGASTSAALRLSLQKRVDKSHRSGSGGSSSSRLRREKYSLRNSESRVERPIPKRRGKRLDSESSHSSTSSSSTTISSSSSSTTTSSSNSSSSSSDEDYIASTSQRRKEGAAAGTRKRSKVRKTRKRKASTSSNRRTTTTTSKRDSRKRKKPNNEYFSGSDDEDDDNGYIGKNFALVMAINECQKRQNRKQKQKHVNKSQEPKEADSDADDAENSWRLMAVNEPLRKQQQQRVKTTHKSAERKRRHKTSSQQQQQKQRNDSDKEKGHNERKRQKFETERQTTDPNYNSDDTSSDESDNINLIQLKTKLTGQDQHKELDADDRDGNKNTEMANETESTITNNEINEQAITIAAEMSEFSNILTSISTVGTTDSIIDTPATAAIYEATSGARGTETTTTNMADLEANQEPNELLHFFDESNDNEHNDNDQNHDHIEAGQRPDDEQEHDHDHDSNSTYHNEQQLLPSTSSLENYQNDETQNNVENNKDLSNNEDPDDDEEEDETLSNVPTNMNLNETNVFADGTSMSTTTTDTILHEAAEQISSAAVNFYNPQQTFNTADFADENSTNSSSSDSSISSTTTSLSSSSNSSSSNTNTSYLNYDH